MIQIVCHSAIIRQKYFKKFEMHNVWLPEDSIQAQVHGTTLLRTNIHYTTVVML